MAAVVKCDSCGCIVPYTKAYHVRAYPMNSATSFNSSNVKMNIEMCDKCFKAFKGALRNGGEQSDADEGTS